jgi:5-methylthioadenosine/S-adenosylhomocysteine deaminase
VQATEDDVDLVVISGQRRYGTAKLMSGASTPTALTVAGRPMQLSLSKPSEASKAWEWSEVIDRLEEVRAHPKLEVDAANAMYARWAGRLDDREAPLRLALDMPTGLAPIGALPKDLNDLVIPPLQSLTHDDEWLDSIVGRGFHAGVLDGLGKYYRR